ncbi:MAG: RluA family pseudouridine synthase [Candidatus Pacebacteria bacterium]|nr:RluA family pseudouridine synthase [Candidatus Paceibacterota bacterium]
MVQEESKISIVFEDENLLVINKPAGLIVHPKNATDTQESVVSLLSEMYPGITNVGEPFIASGTESPRAGIVHRLDKDTSGLLVVAKTNDSFYYLKSLFQTRKIQKHYYALVYGRPKEGHGTIDAPMGRVGLKRTIKLDGKKLIDGKDAITEWSIAKSYDKYTLMDVAPKTGRTHQIRVHLQSIGCPIAGDPVYGPKGWQKPAGLTRLFLHAYKLEFTTQDGKSLVLEAGLPSDLQATLEGLDK